MQAMRFQNKGAKLKSAITRTVYIGVLLRLGAKGASQAGQTPPTLAAIRRALLQQTAIILDERREPSICLSAFPSMRLFSSSANQW
jgi:hypothetical protein